MLSSSSRNRVFVRALIGAGLFAVALLMFARCDWTEPVSSDQLVVEAFLATGEPLPVIALRRTAPLDNPAPDSFGTPARGAEMTLTLDGRRISYEPVPDQPGRYAPMESEVVPARVSYTLEVRWQGREATASGRTPPPLAIDRFRVEVPDEPVEAILVDSLRRDSLDIPAEQGLIYPVEVTVDWTTDFDPVGADSAYWIRTQLTPDTSFSSTVVDLFLQDSEVFPEKSAARRGSLHRWRGVYAIAVDSASSPLPAHHLEVALLRSSVEYASFATTRDDPDRREPISNVDGALGVVAAVALDTQYVTLQP